jgi:hypothetical protein
MGLLRHDYYDYLLCIKKDMALWVTGLWVNGVTHRIWKGIHLL